MWTRKKLEKENIIKQKEQVIRGRAGGSFEPLTNKGNVEVLSNHLSC